MPRVFFSPHFVFAVDPGGQVAAVGPATVSFFLAVLAIAALISLPLIVLVVLGARRRGPDSALAGIRGELGATALWLGWLVAFVSTTGSLYFSEVAHYVPCELCWYQRIAMYPLVIILAVAAVRRDRAVRLYVLPLVAIGASISMYHYRLQVVPSAGGSCDPAAPCTLRYVWEFGFISIPLMAGAGFLLIAALMMISRPPTPSSASTEVETEPRREPVQDTNKGE